PSPEPPNPLPPSPEPPNPLPPPSPSRPRLLLPPSQPMLPSLPPPFTPRSPPTPGSQPAAPEPPTSGPLPLPIPTPQVSPLQSPTFPNYLPPRYPALPPYTRPSKSPLTSSPRPPPHPPPPPTNIALGKLTFASSVSDSDLNTYGPQFTNDGTIGLTGTHIFRSGDGDDSPWLLVDLGGLFTVTRVVYHNRLDCCGDLTARLEVRLGGALITNALTAPQIPLNELVYKMNGSSTTGAVVTIQLDSPITGRYITLQSFGNDLELGNGRDTTDRIAAQLQISELEVYGIPAGMVRTAYGRPRWINYRLWQGWKGIPSSEESVDPDCSLLHYGAGYSNDTFVISTSNQPDEGACCQACFTQATCVHWDFSLSTHMCRLRRDTPSLNVRLNDDRVSGSCNEASTYVSHPQIPTGFSADRKARWISTSAVAFAPIVRQFVATASQNTTFYRAFQVSLEQVQAATAAATGNTSIATLTIVADDMATVFLNNQLLGQAAPFPGQSVFPIPMELLRAADHNVIVVCASSTGGPAVVVASLTAADGTVLVHTDASWNWL
ncbi:hypothetical protein Vretimale_19270, partial [Volvox reticuliferus]